jgi:hypothetical protein
MAAFLAATQQFAANANRRLWRIFDVLPPNSKVRKGLEAVVDPPFSKVASGLFYVIHFFTRGLWSLLGHSVHRASATPAILAASAVLVTDHHIISERCRFQRGIDG